MAFDRFMIAPLNSGLQTDLRPWLILDDSFTALNNVYLFRGRLTKRCGGTLTGSGADSSFIAPFFSRLSVPMGMTDGSGNFVGTVPNAQLGTGMAFSVADEIFTVYQVGAPDPMLDTGAATVKTYNNFTGDVVINGAAANTEVYFYPSNPVMGLTTYDEAGVSVNDQPAYAFDTQFAYVFSGGFWQRSGTAIWHGDNTNFFWSYNWRGITPNTRVLFVTNNQAVFPNGAGDALDDPIWYTSDGATWTAATGANAFYFRPNGGAPQTGPFVKTSRIIVAFKGRLVLLNTIENDNSGGLGVNTQYVNRARWSINGSPFAQNAWYEVNQQDNSGSATSRWAGAAYLDAPTDEAIISAEFIKDRLIVFFERSTWELAYVSNQAQTFAWQKINTELGSEATFSTVPFDRHILTMSNVGVHACNGSNVERIDVKIPQEVFNIRNKNLGVTRVAGIRDYFNELVYWSFPSTTESRSNSIYPNQVLVYNYRIGSWSIFGDTITCYGYFNQQTDQTWASLVTQEWQYSSFSWDDGTRQQQFRQVIAGNQEGFIFVVDSENDRNAPVLQITNISNIRPGYINLNIIQHNLVLGEYIAVENAFNGPGQSLGFPNPTILFVEFVVDENNVTVSSALNPYIQFTGTYVGGGTATLVSPVAFETKQFNPYVDKSRNVYVSKVDFCVIRTVNGEITIDYLTSSSSLSMVSEGQATGTIMGKNILETAAYTDPYYAFEETQVRLWHPIYFQSQGEFIQISAYFSPEQISTPTIAWDDFELEGMVLHTSPTTSRLE